MEKLPYHIVHYSRYDPETTTGGVETFARNLRLIFEQVTFMTPQKRDQAWVQNERIPVICDNQRVLDWPEDIPVIGFQHGVGAVKFSVTHKFNHWRLQRAQRRAAQRRNTLWVACAQWIAETFERLYGNGAAHVIYHPINTEYFDGRLDNDGSRLVLHDARFKHKGRDLIPPLATHFPDWQFESLNCAPHEVPDRMRTARAFIHLSRYEGNSIVCNEAMAMNLPCFFTRVGLMQDQDRPRDVYLIDPDVAYQNMPRLQREVGLFLDSLDTTRYTPRQWTLTHATHQQSRQAWQAVMDAFDVQYR